MRLWPTPRSEKRASLENHGNYVVSGSLNPEFVEWLMMFPIGHTRLHGSESRTARRDLKRSATP
jgi:hypothetical protein